MIYEKSRDLPDKPLVFYTKHADMPKHHHASIEIAYVITGSAELCVEKEKYTLSPHQFAFIGSNAVHSYTAQEGICIVVLLPLAVLAPFRAQLVSCRFTPCVFNDTSDDFVKTLFDTMAKALEHTGDFSAAKSTEALVQSIAETFMRFVFIRAEAVKKINRSVPNGAALNDYLQQNFTSDITALSLSKRFGYTEKHMTDIVKCLFGMPLKDYINMLRINEAKRLLLSRKTIEEVAAHVGFSCTRTFLRTFVRITGLTPAAYRKACFSGSGEAEKPNDTILFHR